jgi:single-strand DNA-binding protein
VANFNFNKAMLGGRLTSDIELKQTPTGVFTCSFSVAVNRKYQKDGERQADFINCVAWRGTAEFISKYFGKGSSIFVVGKIQTRTWTDSNGNKRYATEVIVDEANFVDGKGENASSDSVNGGQANTYIPEAYAPSQPHFEVIEDDGSFPF